MTLVDLVVIGVVALAALRGWRRGGTGLVLRVAGAVAGVLAGGALARWLAPSLPFDAPVTLLGGALIGALLGWGLGRRLGEAVARRGDGLPGLRRPGLPDRVLGVGAHGVLALILLVVAADVVATTGPPTLAAAARDSTLLARAAHTVPDPVALLPADARGVVALHRGPAR